MHAGAAVLAPFEVTRVGGPSICDKGERAGVKQNKNNRNLQFSKMTKKKQKRFILVTLFTGPAILQ